MCLALENFTSLSINKIDPGLFGKGFNDRMITIIRIQNTYYQLILIFVVKYHKRFLIQLESEIKNIISEIFRQENIQIIEIYGSRERISSSFNKLFIQKSFGRNCKKIEAEIKI